MTIGGDLAPHGYPDWQPVRSVADIRLLDVINQATPGNHGPFFVGNYRSLGVRLSADFGRMTMQASYYQKADLTGIIAVQALRVNSASFFNGSLSILGPYVQVSLSDETGGGSQYDLSLALHQHLGNTQQACDANVLAAQTPVNIANGGTNIVQAFQVWPGLASFIWHTAAAAPFNYFIELLTAAGIWAPHAVISATTAEAPFLLQLPPIPVRVRVVNSSGAAADFYYSLIGESQFIRG